MFIKVHTSASNFILVNVSHIVYINPSNSNRGCTIILDTGVRLDSIEDYDVLLQQMMH
ncbi:hypothetical protein [Epilithonimonas sp.]|uniref:hypothetical protein n=1 Tax=Epilithonimonas sp. TaxID=2894511 RepID=UPI0028989B64|nr:hypothetical protein [Epilithonimonas sp.]